MGDDERSQHSPVFFQNGARWVRADFHLHTRSDKEFFYQGDTDSFVSDYIGAIQAAGINVGVVTNHNKFDRDEFRALTKAAKREQIYLLPGVELSVKDGSNGVHLLVVFSEKWISNPENENYIQNFLSVTFSGQANYQSANGRSNDDLHQTIAKLDTFNKDYFLICAHVEEKNGLWKALDGGRLGELARHEPFKERCLGFQKVRTHSRRDIIRQQMQGWYPAEVEGSDSKSLAEVGRGEKTFLKIGAFTFDAVKFALVDPDHRVENDTRAVEHSYVKTVSFEGGKLDGAVINLAPELNTLIGIRGSGKSSILEAVRYGLDIDFGEHAADKSYKEGAVKNALGSGGKITLTAVDRRGCEYEIRRILQEQPDVYVNGALHPGINIRGTVIHKPIYFGQKDLSNTRDGFEKGLVEKLVGDRLTETRESIAGKKHSIVESIRRLQKLTSVSEQQKDHQAKKQDAEYRLKFFQQPWSRRKITETSRL